MHTTRRDVVIGTAAFALMNSLPGRAVAARSEGPIVSKIALADGRVWIAAMIEKHGPYFFIIDTGGVVSLIDNKLAKSLRLKAGPPSQLRGIGGVSQLPWYQAGDVLLGNSVRFPDMVFAGTDANLGKDAVGSFGAGLFTTYDSDLDFEKGEWRVHLNGRSDRQGFHKVKSQFSPATAGGSQVIAEATVGSFVGQFTIDTGAPGEIGLDSRATARSGFWTADRPYAPVRSRGIGKASIPARLVRMDRMKFGPFVFEKPLLMLREPGNTSGSSLPGDGLIGLQTLSRLHLSTDVKARTLWAAPNNLKLPLNTYGLSGIWVEEGKNGLPIVDVGTGSPAAAAGLKVGDVIVGESFSPFVRRISGAAGTGIAFEYERAGKRAKAEFALAEYL